MEYLYNIVSQLLTSLIMFCLNGQADNFENILKFMQGPIYLVYSSLVNLLIYLRL